MPYSKSNCYKQVEMSGFVANGLFAFLMPVFRRGRCEAELRGGFHF
jgi:hypothetical protein